MNYFTKFSRFILYLSIAFEFGSLVVPANAHSQPNYYLIVQSPKSRQDLLTEIASEKDILKRIEALNRLIHTHPDFADAYYQRGLAFSELKNIFEALKNFKQAIQINGYDKVTKLKDIPDNEQAQASDLYYNRALILFQLGDKQGALRDLNWIGGGNLNADGYYLRGRIRSEFGDKSGSENDYNIAASFYLRSINPLEDRFSNPQALPIIAKVIKFSPNNICAYYYRGITQRNNGNVQEAIKSFTQVINIIKHDAGRNFVKHDSSKFEFLPELHEIRGDLYAEFKLNNSQKALEDYNQVVQMEADLKRRGIIHGGGGFNIFCARYIGYQFAQVGSSEKDAQFRLANVYYKRGKIKIKKDKIGAFQDLNKALVIFVDLNDETNEQKVKATLNSIN